MQEVKILRVGQLWDIWQPGYCQRACRKQIRVSKLRIVINPLSFLLHLLLVPHCVHNLSNLLFSLLLNPVSKMLLEFHRQVQFFCHRVWMVFSVQELLPHVLLCLFFLAHLFHVVIKQYFQLAMGNKVEFCKFLWGQCAHVETVSLS